MDYKYNFEILDIKIILLSFNRDYYENIFFYLTKDVLCNNKFIFFSLIISENEISLYIDVEHATNLKKIEYCNSSDDEYFVIRINDESNGINHIGVVNHISSLFTKYAIPILYVNSYNNNYILVPIKEKPKVIRYLDEIIK